jgi:hypothetical protein
MAHAIKVRGRLSDPRHIELDEPLSDPSLSGAVEVIVQAPEELGPPMAARGIVGLCADVGPAPSAQEIDEARADFWVETPRDDTL